MVQRFEYTFELAWKTMKDYLESKGQQVQFPRDVIKEAFTSDILKNGELWIEMLDGRNQLSHTYNRKIFNFVISKIEGHYCLALNEVALCFQQKK